MCSQILLSMAATKIAALVLVCFAQVGAVPLSTFYPFGSGAGDSEIAANDDGYSEQLTIQPFPFFDRTVTSLWVNNNGVVSFDSAVSAYTPESFPITGSALLSPYWGDVDTRGAGRVFYRGSTDPTLLNRASENIRSVFPEFNAPPSATPFTATYLFIATWDHVGYYDSHADKTNTFQSIMVTDGTHSFVIFLYADGLIQWTTGDASGGTGGLGGTPAQGGFNADDGIRFLRIPGSRTGAIVDIDTTSNVGVAGQWTFRVDQNQITTPSPVICLQGCLHGTCVETDTCLCDLGYTGNSCQTAMCEPPCVHGQCVQPDTCACDVGYTGGRCREDINECESSPCLHACSNTDGSFVCTCDDGYILLDDGRSCGDITECETNNGDCDQVCTNSIGSHECSCMPGFDFEAGFIGDPLTNAGRQCIDVDECFTAIDDCQQLCSNTIGSYTCSCNTGYQLMNDRDCRDIDECATGIHICTGLAQCENGIGFFTCICPLGYELDTSLTGCIDIDECQRGTSGCSQQCSNEVGSYTCACSEGYVLGDDQRGCLDVDECQSGNGGCDEFCTNSVGSFKCECSRGFSLQDDGKSCIALECPLLAVPQNGSISCTGRTTGNICDIDCDEGFQLVGSATRICAFSSTWTGTTSFCQSRLCDALAAPTNGAILAPCYQEFGSTCDIVCLHGYMQDGPSEQTCILQSKELVWTQQSQCTASNPCEPNPCQRNGSCSRVGINSFECDCKGTGYEGLTCNTGILTVPLISDLDSRARSVFTVYGKPDESLVVTFRHQSGIVITPETITLNPNNTEITFMLIAHTPRYYLLQYILSGPSAVDFKSPDDSSFLVRSRRSTQTRHSYFQSTGQTVGLLDEGCCPSPDILYNGCPMSTETIRFLSSCEWSGHEDSRDSTGVVFVNINGLSLPLSVAGVNILNTARSIDIQSSQDSLENCERCDLTIPEVTPEEPRQSGDECYHYKYENSDLESFLRSHALAMTYLKQVAPLLPPWIKLSYPNRMNSSLSVTPHDFSTSLVDQAKLSSVDGCGSIDPDYPGLYSVFQHTRSLEVEVFDDFMLYDANDNSVCIAVSLCQDLQSPLYITIPASAQTTLKDMVAQAYLREGWQFSIDSVALYDTGRNITHSRTVWNGNEFYRPQLPLFDVKWLTESNIVMNISDSTTNVRLLFSGTILYVFAHSKEKTALLEGNLELEVLTEIGGYYHGLQLSSSNSAVFSASEDNEGMCSQGLSMLMGYTPRAEQPFFSTLFSLEEIVTMCDMHVFLHTDYDINLRAIRMQTDCPQLLLDRLLFPQMTHTLFFDDFDFHNSCTPELGTLTDPGLVVLSTLQNSQLALGNYFVAFPGPQSVALSVEFFRNSQGFIAQLHNVEVSLLNTIIRTPVVLEQGALRFTAVANISNRYPASLSVEAATNASWERLALNVHGEMLDSFKSDVQQYVNTHVMDSVIQGAIQREMLANSAVENANEALEMLESMVMERQEHLSVAAAAVEDAMSMLSTANESLVTAEGRFTIGSTMLQTLRQNLTSICEEENCTQIQVCTDERTIAFRDVFIPEQGTCQVPRTVNVSFPSIVRYDTIEEWVFETFCSEECERGCLVFCKKSLRPNCRGVYIRRYRTVPVTEIVQRQVIEVVEEECTIQRLYFTMLEATLSRSCRRVPDIPCLQVCRLNQELAIGQLEEELATPFQSLDDARTNFTIAQTTLSQATARQRYAQQMLEGIIPSYETAQMTRNISQRSYDAVVRDIRSKLQLAAQLNESEMPQIVFNRIIFDIQVSTQSPDQFPLRFEYSIPGGQSFEAVVLFDFIAPFELNLRRIAEEVSSMLLNRTAVNKRSTETRFKRQDGEEIVDRRRNEMEFEAMCVELNNLKQYIQSLVLPLEESASDTLEARRELAATLSELRNEMQIDGSKYQATINLDALQNLFNISSRVELQGNEVTELYQSFIQDLILITANISDSFDETAFMDWQATMMMLHDQLDSVAGYPCTGFPDCLATAVSILKQLITDNTQQDAKELLEQLTDIETDVYKVSTAINITVENALDTFTRLLGIASSDTLETYWCSSIPEITASPPLQVNISRGDNLVFNCSAESTLPITFHWRKNDVPIPNANTDTFVIRSVQRSDQGNYSCHVANVIGSSPSFVTNVLVYEIPEFVLEPIAISVRAGDENGAIIACNATAWPYPGWRWLYRESERDDWQLLEDEEINEISIPSPQQENQGYYTCETYNYHGVLRATPAYLTVLPISVSQLSVSVSFDVLPLENCSQLSKESIVLLISQNINMLSTSITDIVIMEGEVCNVMLTIASQNATTERSSYETLGDIENMALPSRRDLLQVKEALRSFIRDSGDVVESSLTFGIMTYLCPPGQQLHSDFLLCISCGPASYQTSTEQGRIYSGEGLRERYPVCTPCPFNHYEEHIGSVGCQACPDYHQTHSAGANSSSLCYVEPLLFECRTEGSSTTQVTITCRSNRPATRILCSFDGGREHQCELPLVINQQTALLPGPHSVIISASGQFGYDVQQAVDYVLAETEKTNLFPDLLPLGVHFINGSPRVGGDTVEVDFELTRPAASVTCQINKEDAIDCSSGRVVYTGLVPKRYTVRVVAVNTREDRAIVSRRFQVHSDPDYCTMHLVNEGVIVTGNNVTVEFAVVGPAEGVTCQLDSQPLFSCERKLTLFSVSVGKHRFRAIPESGCSNYRKMSLKFAVQ